MKRIIDKLEELRKESLTTGLLYAIVTVIWIVIGTISDCTQNVSVMLTVIVPATLVLAIVFLTRAYDYKQLKETMEREEQIKEKEKEKENK